MHSENTQLNETLQGTATLTLAKKENQKSVFIESYGCQMNFSDSEIVASILSQEGFNTINNYQDADLILLNTCSIREKAEQTVRNKLQQFHKLKKEKPHLIIGVLGCMAERLKEKFLEQEKLVDLVVGPDAYKSLPSLLQEVNDGKQAINVILSREETYADISPVRLNSNGVTAFVTITRGCDNMCTFCVVPFTRGRERSRNPESILEECQDLWDRGYKEITLLGQNVDSFLWYGGGAKKDFNKASELQQATAMNFAQLLIKLAEAYPRMRLRFATSNPQDMSLDVAHAMLKHNNICRYIHLPIQSGSTSVLKRMNRQHSREEYLDLIRDIKAIVPDIAFSQDIIAGFCDETEEEHKETLSLMEEVQYDYGFMFAYSDRPGTPAHKKLVDNVPLKVKKRRLNEIISLQRGIGHERLKGYVGKTFEVLIEKKSKRDEQQWSGRTSQNTVAVFDKKPGTQPGDFVFVKMTDCTSGTLMGKQITQRKKQHA